MKNLTFVFALISTSFIHAQIGIGTATPNASAILDVTSSSKGFLQPRVALTGTADTATITTPATGLMVFNTATAGSGATAVTPGVYYHNGTAWQRVANQAEVAAATASTTTFVNGNLGSSLITTMSSGPTFTSHGAKNFGASITLPPGKWEVVLELTASIELQFSIQPEIAFMNYWLEDTSPTNQFSYFTSISGTAIGTSDALVTGSAAFVRPISNGGFANHSGKFYIYNSTQNDKTYSLYFFEYAPYADPNLDDTAIFHYNKFGGAAGMPGNRFYATKIN